MKHISVLFTVATCLVLMTSYLHAQEIKILRLGTTPEQNIEIKVLGKTPKIVKRAEYSENIVGNDKIVVFHNINYPCLIKLNETTLFITPTSKITVGRRPNSQQYVVLNEGSFQAENNLLLLLGRDDMKFKNYQPGIDSTFFDYKRKLLKRRDSQNSILDASSSNLDPVFVPLIKNYIIYDYINHLLSVNSDFSKFPETRKISPDILSEIDQYMNHDENICTDVYILAAINYNNYLADFETKGKIARDEPQYLSTLVNSANKNFRGKTREYIICNIFSRFSFYKRDAYYKKFITSINEQITAIKDEEAKLYLEEIRFRYDAVGRTLPESVVSDTLIGTDGVPKSLGDILSAHTGKKIYVTFWASWCAPCIKDIPLIVELEKRLENRRIAFIHISVDDDRDNWASSIRKNHLTSNSYVLREKDAQLKSYLSLSAIPRHILLDEDQKLLDLFAPLPAELDKYNLLKINRTWDHDERKP